MNTIPINMISMQSIRNCIPHCDLIRWETVIGTLVWISLSVWFSKNVMINVVFIKVDQLPSSIHVAIQTRISLVHQMQFCSKWSSPWCKWVNLAQGWFQQWLYFQPLSDWLEEIPHPNPLFTLWTLNTYTTTLTHFTDCVSIHHLTPSTEVPLSLSNRVLCNCSLVKWCISISNIFISIFLYFIFIQFIACT